MNAATAGGQAERESTRRARTDNDEHKQRERSRGQLEELGLRGLSTTAAGEHAEGEL